MISSNGTTLGADPRDADSTRQNPNHPMPAIVRRGRGGAPRAPAGRHVRPPLAPRWPATPPPGPPLYWSIDNSENTTQLVRKSTHNHAHKPTYADFGQEDSWVYRLSLIHI